MDDNPVRAVRKPWTLLDIGGFLPLKGAPSPLGFISPFLPAGERGSLLFPSLVEVSFWLQFCSNVLSCLLSSFCFVMLIGEVNIFIGGNIILLESGHGALFSQYTIEYIRKSSYG